MDCRVKPGNDEKSAAAGALSTVSAAATVVGLPASIRAIVGRDFHALTKSVDDDAG
jgi:hypothetical protein